VLLIIIRKVTELEEEIGVAPKVVLTQSQLKNSLFSIQATNLMKVRATYKSKVIRLKPKMGRLISKRIRRKIKLNKRLR
jgi:hypothetical protein